MSAAPRRLLAALAAVLLAGVLLAGPVTAQEADDGPEVPTGEIVPKPNSGHAPEEAGDRGGALQLGLLGLMVVSVIAVGVVINLRTREHRRARNAVGRPPTGADAT